MRLPLELPAGIISDDTGFANNGHWADGSNVRFWRGKPQTIGGWERIITTAVTGTCRKVFGWSDNSANLNIALGTHSKLQLWQGGALYNITPFGPPALLGSAPLTTINASAVVTVVHTSHGLTTGNPILVAGAVAVGGITPNGGPFSITVLDANSYTYTYSSNATSGVTGGGVGVIITPQVELPAGNIHGTGGAGYGTGTYSTGTYSSPSTVDYFPRTWSLSSWGQNLIANPRNGAIYTWTNVTATKALVISTAPPQVTYSLAAPTRQVFALGCNQEASPYTFDPLVIRHSSVGDNTVWNTAASTTAREYRLPGGGRIVAGAVMGQNLLIWTTGGLWLGSFVGSLDQPWRFDQVGDECGLAGPNAFVVVGQRAFWMAPSLQLYSYALGGEPYIIDCPVRQTFADNLTPAQGDKITASSNALFNEIRWDYPDARDGLECSRYIAAHVPTLLNDPESAWYLGINPRTAFVDVPPAPNSYPISTDPSGNLYWQDKGNTADGAVLTWFLETADDYLDPAQVMQLRGIWPDFKDQIGPIAIQATTRLFPQGDETVVSGTTVGPGDSKSDIRATGRTARVKFSGSSAPAYARFGDPVLDVTPSGQR